MKTIKGMEGFVGNKKMFRKYLDILKKLAFIERYGWLSKGGEK